jgi:hypothetical protein
MDLPRLTIPVADGKGLISQAWSYFLRDLSSVAESFSGQNIENPAQVGRFLAALRDLMVLSHCEIPARDMTGDVDELGMVVLGQPAQKLIHKEELVPIGGIIGWTGEVDSIPENYALCDGTEGTPDLTSLFLA